MENKKVEESKNTEKKNTNKKKWIWARIIVVVLVMLGIIGIFVKSKFDKVKQTDLEEENLTVNEEMEEENQHYLNVALFGVDAHSDEQANVQSDAIVIVSLNQDTKEVKMATVYGNALLVDRAGNVIAAKNIYNDGAENAVEILNRNLDLDISHFATVDFQAMIDVIDTVGGVEVDVTEEEIPHIAGYTADLNTVTGKESAGVMEPGLQILNGTQATAYCRIRATEGADVTRSERQTEIISKVMEKLVQLEPAQLNELVDKVFPEIETNFKLTELINYAADLKEYQIDEMLGFPFEISEKKVENMEDAMLPSNYKEDVQKLHQQIFPDMEYTPTENIDKAVEAFEKLP